jgi:hypothetical protein
MYRQFMLTLVGAAVFSTTILATGGTAESAHSRDAQAHSAGTTTAATHSAVARTAAATPGPYATFLFSRTEMVGAVNCVANGTGIARLDTEVAPYLASLGMSATGTLVTGKIGTTSRVCTHEKASLMGSWADATSLQRTFGWRFVSHTATYPSNLPSLSSSQKYAETCGSAKTIDAHGLLGGHGLIAYPGAQTAPEEVQANYSSKCFAWGRKYNSSATTSISAAATFPYWQYSSSPQGGPCNDSAAACYKYTPGARRYVLPSQFISRVNALVPGKWMTIQAFILVKGTNPAGSAIKWDCTASTSRLHWTNDNERYCLRDWKQIVAAIDARSDITVTDPLSVGVAFGRPGSY